MGDGAQRRLSGRMRAFNLLGGERPLRAVIPGSFLKFYFQDRPARPGIIFPLQEGEIEL